jgi:hypothetical protein
MGIDVHHRIMTPRQRCEVWCVGPKPKQPHPGAGGC